MNKYFCPQPDITTYELARIMIEIGPTLRTRPIMFTGERWESLPANIKRHFGSAPMPPLV